MATIDDIEQRLLQAQTDLDRALGQREAAGRKEAVALTDIAALEHVRRLLGAPPSSSRAEFDGDAEIPIRTLVLDLVRSSGEPLSPESVVARLRESTVRDIKQNTVNRRAGTRLGSSIGKRVGRDGTGNFSSRRARVSGGARVGPNRR